MSVVSVQQTFFSLTQRLLSVDSELKDWVQPMNPQLTVIIVGKLRYRILPGHSGPQPLVVQKGWNLHPGPPSWTSILLQLVDSLKQKLFLRFYCQANFPSNYLSIYVKCGCSWNGEIVWQKYRGNEAIPLQFSQFFFQQEGWLANSLIKGRSSCNLLSQPHLGCLYI